jgi:hypothetical protein
MRPPTTSTTIGANLTRRREEREGIAKKQEIQHRAHGDTESTENKKQVKGLSFPTIGGRSTPLV